MSLAPLDRSRHCASVVGRSRSCSPRSLLGCSSWVWRCSRAAPCKCIGARSRLRCATTRHFATWQYTRRASDYLRLVITTTLPSRGDVAQPRSSRSAGEAARDSRAGVSLLDSGRRQSRATSRNGSLRIDRNETAFTRRAATTRSSPPRARWLSGFRIGLGPLGGPRTPSLSATRFAMTAPVGRRRAGRILEGATSFRSSITSRRSRRSYRRRSSATFRTIRWSR